MSTSRRAYRDVVHNTLINWIGRGMAGMATREVLAAIRDEGYAIVPAEQARRAG